MTFAGTAIPVLILALRFLPGGPAPISYLGLAVYAMLGRMQALQGLALLWIFNVLSLGIAPDVPQATLLRYVVIAAAASSIALRAGSRLQSITVATLGLGVCIVTHSLLISPIPSISALKALAWTVAVSTSVEGWAALPGRKRDILSDQLYYGLALVLAVSVPLIWTRTGYLRNGTGFQGILRHPQIFGPTMSILATWTFARIFAGAKRSRLSYCILITSIYLILLSEARTAALAILLALALAFTHSLLADRQRLVQAVRTHTHTFVIAALLIPTLLILFFPVAVEYTENFLSKSGRAESASIIDAYQNSRGALIEDMIKNIRTCPMSGIGFGIASNPQLMVVSHDPFFGIPIGAAVEKGNAFFAIVEELGAFGALLVALWIIRLISTASRSGLAPFSVLITCLLLNIGEATLFSPGGAGLLYLVLIGWASSPTRHHAASTNN